MLQFGATIPPNLPVRMQVQMAMALEWLGFDSIWMSDHVLFPEPMPCPDVWTVIAAAATRTRRIRFGTSVSDPHRCHPAVLAQRLATLDQLSRGRIMLGLGSGESMNLDPFGIPWDRRLTRMRESIRILRGLLDSDEPLTFDGQLFRLRAARLTVRPWKRRKIPLYLAALGPKMQRLAGEVADGWAPVNVPVEHYAALFEPIRQAALAVGRNPDDIDRMAGLVVSLTEREEPVMELLQEHALGIVWPAVFERVGIPVPPAPDGSEESYISVNPCDPESLGRFNERQRVMPRDVLRRVVHLGDMRKIRRVIGDFIDAGATHLHITNASLDPTRMLTLAADILPYFRRRRAPLYVVLGERACAALRRAGVIRELDPRRGMEWLNRQQ